MVAADNYVLKHYGFPLTNINQYRALFRVPIRDYWIDLGLDPKFFDRNASDIERMFMAKYEPLENTCRSRAGAKNALRWLKKNKIETIIYSNHIVPHIQKQLKRLKLNEYVSDILARADIEDHSHLHRRFKEVRLRSFIRKLKLKPNQIVLVGDTVEEIENARELGCHSLALSGGHNSIARLKAAKPDFLIHNLKELKNIIKKLNKD